MMFVDTLYIDLYVNLKQKLPRDRYVFVDDEGFYYFWQLSFSEYGCCIDITSLKVENDVFIRVKNKKNNMLIQYLQDILSTQNGIFIETFFRNIENGFIVDQKYIDSFGKKFCNEFLLEQDREFIFQDKYAKHLVIDFNKIKKREIIFFYQAELLPLYIPEIGVTITKDFKIVKDDKEVDLKTCWNYYDQYKSTLINRIKQKNEIFFRIEKDLEYRYTEEYEAIKTKKNINDYEVEAYIQVFDTFFSDYEISTLNFTKRSFSNRQVYSLKLFGFDLEVHGLFYHLIDSFGINIVMKELYFWSEIKVRNQKFFKI